MIPFPEILYKYLDSEGAAVFLKQPQLRFTDWRKLDDLMEILPGQRPLTEEEIHQLAADQSVKRGVPYEQCRKFAAELSHDPEWERTLRRLFASQPCHMFICCFTERWDSGAMWALYAKKHSGIVIGLRSEGLPVRASAVGKVAYSEIRPQMPMVKVDPSVLAQAAGTKSLDWAYQKEWRAASGNGEVEILEPKVVAEIVVGYQASLNLIERVKAFKIQNPSTKIFHAYPHPQRHEMARTEI